VFLDDFATDFDDIAFPDTDVTFSSEKVTPKATTQNFRLPTMVSVTMGEDSQTSAYINWFSKSTLEATDIEIYEYDSEILFSVFVSNIIFFLNHIVIDSFLYGFKEVITSFFQIFRVFSKLV
jgi:hypothetical protein